MHAIESEVDRHLSAVEAAVTDVERRDEQVEAAVAHHHQAIVRAYLGSHALDGKVSDLVENVRYSLERGDVWGAATELAHSGRVDVAARTFEALLDVVADEVGAISPDAARTYRVDALDWRRREERAKDVARLAGTEHPCGASLPDLTLTCRAPAMHDLSAGSAHQAEWYGRVVTWR